MKIKSIFLSLFFVISVQAKPAPENTFKLDTKINPLPENSPVEIKKKELQDKIAELKSRRRENLFVDNLNNLKLYYLEAKLNLKSKDLN